MELRRILQVLREKTRTKLVKRQKNSSRKIFQLEQNSCGCNFFALRSVARKRRSETLAQFLRRLFCCLARRVLCCVLDQLLHSLLLQSHHRHLLGSSGKRFATRCAFSCRSREKQRASRAGRLFAIGCDLLFTLPRGTPCSLSSSHRRRPCSSLPTARAWRGRRRRCR